MNHLALLIGSYLAIASQQDPATLKASPPQWESYKMQFGKQYEDTDVELMRSMIFAQNKQRIEEFNRSPLAQNFTLALNHLADLSEPERESLNGFRLSSGQKRPINSIEAEKFLNEILNDNSTEVPDELDWRKTPNKVSRVKDQGQCGSCWAFATTGLLEGQVKTRGSNGNNFVELSEQNLVDCVIEDAGCDGGIMSDALMAIKSEGGIDDEESYPYEALQRKCRFKKDKVALTDSGFAILPEGDEQKLKETVAKYGPVAVAIQVIESFQFYDEGVYYDRFCTSTAEKLNHGVLVVGYGTDKKAGDYWIVKNSWGPDWGENGYIRMARNKRNNCGIATVATIATF